MPTHVAQRAPMRCSRPSDGRGGIGGGGLDVGVAGSANVRGGAASNGGARSTEAVTTSGGGAATGVAVRRPAARAGCRGLLEGPNPVEQQAHLGLERGDAPVRALGRARSREQRDDGGDQSDHGQEQAERE